MVLDVESIRRMTDELVSREPPSPMTEDEMVSRLSPKHQRMYRRVMGSRSRQFRRLRRELFRSTIGGRRAA